MYTCRRRHRHIPAFYIVVGLCLSIVKFLGHPQTTIFFQRKWVVVLEARNVKGDMPLIIGVYSFY